MSDSKPLERPKFHLKTEEMTTNPDEKPSRITPVSGTHSKPNPIRISQTSNATRTQVARTTTNNNKQTKFQFSEFYLSDLKNIMQDTSQVIRQDQTPTSQKRSPRNFEGSPDSYFPMIKQKNDVVMRTQQKILESIPNHIREFYSNRKDFNKIFDDFDKVNFCLDSVMERVKCYRFELGNLIMKCSQTFRGIFEKVLDHSIKLYNECKIKSEKQMQENLAIIDKLEREKKDLEIKNRNLKNLYNFQESEYKICKINSDALQNEIVLLHELLKKDVLSLINHLGTIENVNQKGFQLNDPSDSLALGLNDLNKIINTLEEEQNNKNNLMGDMNNLLKAMLKGGKQDAYTQIDEGELVWKPELIIKKSELHNNLTVMGSEGYSINLETKYSDAIENKTNLEILKLKEKEFNKADGSDKQELGENWNLPISLIVFLENVTKQNESGRVLPWNHFKKNIFEVYNERLKYMWEIKSSLINTFVTMDEFLCIYFLKTYKLRRIAEIKLLEFLVSLKYYSKIWSRATIFACITGISTYVKSGTTNEPNFSYDFDAYVQEYFFFLFSKINSESLHIFDHSEGQTYMPKEKLEEVVKQTLFFYNENEKRRFLSKSIKITRKINPEDIAEYIDVDKLFESLIEEYFETKKKNFKILAKNFSKFYESDHGLLSYDDVKSIVSEVTDIESPIPGNLYANDFTKLRLFLYSLTSTKNKYDILNKDFLIGCSKFGVDSPFPFLCVEKNGAFNMADKGFFSEINELNKLKGTIVANAHELNKKKDNSLRALGNVSRGDFEDDDKRNEKKGKTMEDLEGIREKTTLKIDSSSSMFAQHFSILRELRHYCLQLKDAVKNENDLDVVWKHMDNIINILEVGCQFLNFPIQIS